MHTRARVSNGAHRRRSHEAAKAGDAVAALKKSLKPNAHVKRDGKWQTIDAGLLVPARAPVAAPAPAPAPTTRSRRDRGADATRP